MSATIVYTLHTNINVRKLCNQTVLEVLAPPVSETHYEDTVKAGKFDGELNLVVWWSGLRLPNLNLPILFLPTMHNDVLHVVVLLAPPGVPLHELYMYS